MTEDGRLAEREPMNERERTRLLAVFEHAGRLKRLPRAGWLERGVNPAESVAEHSFRMALMAVFLGRGMDRAALLATALIHDLAEAVVGDLTPGTTVDPREKQRAEEEALRTILDGVDGAGELMELWRDFELRRTPEGRLLKDLDKLEMAVQALEYAREGAEGLEEFLADAERSIEDPRVRELLVMVKEQFAEVT
jgi:5'-deoxynucleotidase YfbR-like HD superfamily hydrolase